jgi:tetratricopeptide (TPR) repeat protein
VAEVDRRRLRNEIELLEASLRDAQDEYAAGELDDVSHRAILARDTDRLEALRTELVALPAPEAAPSSSGGRAKARRWWLLGAGVVLLGGAIVLVVVLSMQSWPSKAEQVRQLLSKATALDERGQLTRALPLYNDVLKLDPRQPVALAESGWILFKAGSAANDPTLMAKGEQLVRASIQAAPSFPAGHLYLGLIDLLAAKDAKGAIAEFQAFVELKPSAYWLGVAKPFMERAAAEAGVPVPTATP